MFKLPKIFMIYLSLNLALLGMIVPFPYHWQWIRPEWISLMLIYWVFREPARVGVATGWMIGLCMDVLGGVLLGQYALAMALLTYLAHLLRNRLRFFPFWQQAFVILVLVGIGQLILLLIQWFIGRPPRTLLYWSSTLTSVLLWPWLYRIMHFCERKLIYN